MDRDSYAKPRFVAPVSGERVPNEVFYATPEAATRVAVVPEDVFYARRQRPPVEVPVAVKAAATPVRFALILFLVGWAGIIFQRGFLQQVVFGAPVFEELAKFGPPLLLVSLLGIRSVWLRLPLALLSGAGFGVFEHYATYAAEDAVMFAERVTFHAVSPALSMLTWGALEDLPDVRARWAATIPATLFHWANNFLAVVLGIGSALAGLDAYAEPVGVAVASVITGTMIGLLLVGLAARRRFEARVRRTLSSAMPRLGLTS